jgi:dinuclear metal center YbgI/SA1388 family protein
MEGLGAGVLLPGAGGREGAGAGTQLGRWPSHSGFKVATTNKMARQTVIVCAKINQSLRIGVSVDRNELATYLAQFLAVDRLKDYCPNGLQVEGRGEVGRILTGVTASRLLLQEAVARGVDAVLVHHGYFWRGEDPRLVGIKKQRVQLLLAHDINLFAYHLPLDVHPEVGNNVQLARQLGLEVEGRFGENDLGFIGNAPGLSTVGELARRVAERLGREPLAIGAPDQPLGRVAWCTGAAQGMLADAIAAGAGTYLSGEISEPTVHLARESGVAYLAAGHHATERYGIRALGEHLAARFGLEHVFLDMPNPV